MVKPAQTQMSKVYVIPSLTDNPIIKNKKYNIESVWTQEVPDISTLLTDDNIWTTCKHKSITESKLQAFLFVTFYTKKEDSINNTIKKYCSRARHA